MSFVDWWSLLSTVIGVILAGVSIWQYIENRDQKEKVMAQVKVWMEGANGVSQALQRIVRDNIDKRYSSTDDVCNAIWAVQSAAFALYQSLYEERCVTEEEYRARQKKLWEKLEAQQFNLNPAGASNASTISPIQVKSEK
jgi:hypothetical protein